MTLTAIASLLVATLGGAAIGVERQWSGHATGERARFGGVRTFTLLGGLAGLCGWLTLGGFLAIAVVLLAAAAAVIAISYAVASRRDIDATTEVAAIVVLAAGTIAGAGHMALSSAVLAATALLLVEKSRLHTLVARIDDASLRASARFAALACILLPLLPEGPYGPFAAIRPRELWAIVLFLSGLSFAGWIARRLAGAHQGTILSALLGGVISSTSVTLRLARDSRAAQAPLRSLAAGAVGASTVMLVRVAVVCAVLNPSLAATLPRYLTLPFAIGAAIVWVLWISSTPAAAGDGENGSPLQLGSALQMAGLFQLVLFLILAVQATWGAQALVTTSVFVGLTDLDALTLSLARGAAPLGDLRPVTLALVAGIISNTLLKLSVAIVVGRGAFRLITAAALGAMTCAMAGALVLV
jgi:uncharacterized membrane protein (DUF4010 family)